MPALVACAAPRPPHQRGWIDALRTGDNDRRVRAAYMLSDPQITGPPAVAALIHALEHDGHPPVRAATAHSLGRAGDARAVRPLIAAATDDDAAVRTGAVRALGHVFARTSVTEADRVAPVFLAAATDPDDRVRHAAADAMLATYDRRMLPHAEAFNAAALVLLRDESADVRRAAAGVLGRTAFTTNWDPLAAALKDANPAVRRATASALGNVAQRGHLSGFHPDARPLREAMDDEEKTVRAAAATALGHHGDAAGVPLLVRALAEDPAPEVRVAAAGALAGTKNEHALTALIDALEQTDRAVADAAVEAVARRGADVIPALVDALKRTRPVHASGLMRALDRLDRHAAAPLRETLADEPPEVRESAARALGFILAGNRADTREAAEQTVERLCALAREDAAGKVRAAAIDALGTIGSAAATPTLIEMLKHEEPALRAAAAQALGYLNPPRPSAVVMPPSGDARAVAPLIDALDDEDATVADTAADALCLLPRRVGQHEEALRRLLKHADPEVRARAVRAMAGFPPLAAQNPSYRQLLCKPEVLAALLKDPDWRVRREAVRRFRVRDLAAVMLDFREHVEVRLAAAERIAASLSPRPVPATGAGAEAGWARVRAFGQVWRDTANPQPLRVFAWRAWLTFEVVPRMMVVASSQLDSAPTPPYDRQ